jgi:hypothetical protein
LNVGQGLGGNVPRAAEGENGGEQQGGGAGHGGIFLLIL